MNVRRVIVLLAPLLLADCGSSPKTHYFTLAAVPGTSRDKPSLSSPVTVAAVHVPASLDHQEMVRRVLSQDLAARLPSGAVVLPDAPAPPRTAQIVLAIEQFGPDLKGEATLQGSWTLLEAGRSEPVLRRDIHLQTNAPATSGSSAAAAMSQLVGQLATRIAAALADGPVAPRSSEQHPSADLGPPPMPYFAVRTAGFRRDSL